MMMMMMKNDDALWRVTWSPYVPDLSISSRYVCMSLSSTKLSNDVPSDVVGRCSKLLTISLRSEVIDLYMPMLLSWSAMVSRNVIPSASSRNCSPLRLRPSYLLNVSRYARDVGNRKPFHRILFTVLLGEFDFVPM